MTGEAYDGLVFTDDQEKSSVHLLHGYAEQSISLLPSAPFQSLFSPSDQPTLELSRQSVTAKNDLHATNLRYNTIIVTNRISAIANDCISEQLYLETSGMGEIDKERGIISCPCAQAVTRFTGSHLSPNQGQSSG